jgi:hypothetical protein
VVSVCCLPDPSERIKNFAKNKKQIKTDVATWVPHPTVPRRGRIEKNRTGGSASHEKPERLNRALPRPGAVVFVGSGYQITIEYPVYRIAETICLSFQQVQIDLFRAKAEYVMV